MKPATRAEAHAYLADLLAGENAVVIPVHDREEAINALARQSLDEEFLCAVEALVHHSRRVRELEKGSFVLIEKSA